MQDRPQDAHMQTNGNSRTAGLQPSLNKVESYSKGKPGRPETAEGYNLNRLLKNTPDSLLKNKLPNLSPQDDGYVLRGEIVDALGCPGTNTVTELRADKIRLCKRPVQGHKAGEEVSR